MRFLPFHAGTPYGRSAWVRTIRRAPRAAHARVAGTGHALLLLGRDPSLEGGRGHGPIGPERPSANVGFPSIGEGRCAFSTLSLVRAWLAHAHVQRWIERLFVTKAASFGGRSDRTVGLMRRRFCPRRHLPPPPTHRWGAGGSRGVPGAWACVGVCHAAAPRPAAASRKMGAQLRWCSRGTGWSWPALRAPPPSASAPSSASIAVPATGAPAFTPPPAAAASSPPSAPRSAATMAYLRPMGGPLAPLAGAGPPRPRAAAAWRTPTRVCALGTPREPPAPQR